jgi:hypothetical protein
MADSIQQARQEVQIAFEAAVAWAENRSRRTFAVFEARAWTLVLAVGRALVQLFLAHEAARTRPLAYRHDGTAYRLDDQRVSELGTRFGKVPFARPVGRSVADRRAAADLPVDRALGLCGGFSLGVVTGVTRLVAQMAFGAARQSYREIYEWAPSPRAVLRMVDGVGARARAFLEQATVPADEDGEVLVIQVDGRGAPMISADEHARRRCPHEPRVGTGRWRRRRRRQGRARVRRTKGQKSKNAKVAVVGVLYTLQSTPEGTEGPIHKRIYATFESHRALFAWLRREADKRGYGTKRTILLGDGSDHIWRLQQEYFPQAEACLDWYHAMEYLWEAGQSLYPEGSPELRTWVGQQARVLRRSETTAVLTELRRIRAAIPRTGPGTKGKRRRLDDTLRYFVNNRRRLIYRQLRRDDLDIGSGAVEGAVRNLVGMRLDGPGMRWSRQRSEMVLHLRCILLNGQWQAFVDYLTKQAQLLLPAQPVPTIPHTATKKAA